MVSFHLMQKDGVPNYRYGGWWSVWWMGTYSMVLSKAAFFHRKYLDLYTNVMPSSIHDYVTRERSAKWFSSFIQLIAFLMGLCLTSLCMYWCRNCEDIAMSLLVANATGSPPVWVKGNAMIIYAFCYVM